MSRILIVAEHDGRHLNAATAKCVRCALGLADARIDIAVFGQGIGAIAAEAAALEGVNQVLAIDDAAFQRPLAALLAPAVVALAGDATHLLGPSTTFGKDLMPRIAALLGVGQVSDIMAVEAPRRFRRPVYAGNAVVSVEVEGDAPIVATVRTASFTGVGAAASPATVSAVSNSGELPTHTRFVSLSAAGGDRPDLQTATRVVAGGRALGSAENFKLIQDLADAMGAAVGASRAAVDAGYAPNELQVGQTGKIIAPELYVAVGISGAIQHMTGIKDARTIVAINKDGDAPIFEAADYGLVGDLFTILPDLKARLAK
jgi:electron transfer flavoprotein alpha subunit